MGEEKRVKISAISSLWRCESCEQEAEWTFMDVAEAGGPICAECDEDMEPVCGLVKDE